MRLSKDNTMNGRSGKERRWRDRQHSASVRIEGRPNRLPQSFSLLRRVFMWPQVSPLDVPFVARFRQLVIVS